MKHIKLFEEFLNESFGFELNESFKSSKLRDIFSYRGKIDQMLLKAFYQTFSVQLDQIEDIDIVEMDPDLAAREKRENAIYFYLTTSKKQNPYAHNDAYDKYLNPGTLLAVTDGNKKFYDFMRKYIDGKSRTVFGTDPLSSSGNRIEDIGVDKSRGKYSSGLNTVKKVADVADVAYVIDLTALKARYDSSKIVANRRAARSGATALMDDEQFKKENMKRYQDILSARLKNDDIDTLVKDAIEILANGIKNAILKKETSPYGELLTDFTGKIAGSRVAISYVNFTMRDILETYGNYVYSSNKSVDSRNKKDSDSDSVFYERDSVFYEREAKGYALKIREEVNKIKKGKIY